MAGRAEVRVRCCGVHQRSELAVRPPHTQQPQQGQDEAELGLRAAELDQPLGDSVEIHHTVGIVRLLLALPPGEELLPLPAHLVQGVQVCSRCARSLVQKALSELRCFANLSSCVSQIS